MILEGKYESTARKSPQFQLGESEANRRCVIFFLRLSRLIMLIGIFLFAGGVVEARRKPLLTLASTTSTQDTGLFDVLIPTFEQKYNCRVRVIAVGTGHAIRLARDGNADVLLVHDRVAEERFVADGFGVERLDVMHNNFLLVGPKNDPANAKGLDDAAVAFKKISETNSPFISRGDNSGTHKKEISIWEKSGIKPGGKWYIESGSGQETTLRIANEKKAYCLVDSGTWLYIQKEIDALAKIAEGDSILHNPYSVIVVSPVRFPWVQYDLAQKFAEFIRCHEGQRIIGEFGVDKFGAPLFHPDVITGK